MSSETIKFRFTFLAEYWDKPPAIILRLDDKELFNGVITQEQSILEFKETITFGRHKLSIDRQGKDNSQTKLLPDGSYQDQLLTLDKLVIDDVDIRDIVNHYSYTKPIYPEPWASLERRKGNDLPEYVRGQTCWGHNLTWTLKFTSPFYLHVMNWMRGNLNEQFH